MTRACDIIVTVSLSNHAAKERTEARSKASGELERSPVGQANPIESREEGQCRRSTSSSSNSGRLIQPPFRSPLLRHSSYTLAPLRNAIIDMDARGAELESRQAGLCLLWCSRRPGQGVCQVSHSAASTATAQS